MPESTLEIRIPSLRKNIALVEPFLRSIDSFRELEESKYYNALIAITEAVNNAIVHGNQCDEQKIVVLSLLIDIDAIHISVLDQGQGFNPDAVPDPRRKENILKDGGRGVFLIHSLVDDAVYSNTGNGMKLEMTIRR